MPSAHSLHQLDHDERCDWLRLLRTPHVGAATFHALLSRYGSAGAALDALPDLRARTGAKIGASPSKTEVEEELTRVHDLGARLIAYGETDYPPLLAAIENAPPLLYVKGRTELFLRPALAIVGARNASAVGRKFAAQLAGELTDAGYLIVSGLARGIDTSAHEGALAQETGATCAVVAGGLDILYPPENEMLYARIQEQALAVAEMPLRTQPQARHFPRRNRIISGLSLGVIVVEAALHSGSLITARLALEQNRDVFAVPGSPLDPRAQGTNDLIRQGAALITCSDDILSALHIFNPPLTSSPPVLRDEFSPEARAGDVGVIAGLLSPVPVEIDALVRLSGLSAPIVLSALLEIELSGGLERHVGQRVSTPA